jgi:hypothetical protein
MTKTTDERKRLDEEFALLKSELSGPEDAQDLLDELVRMREGGVPAPIDDRKRLQVEVAARFLAATIHHSATDDDGGVSWPSIITAVRTPYNEGDWAGNQALETLRAADVLLQKAGL